jgi:DNA-binding NarL/FixJ family response regulator
MPTTISQLALNHRELQILVLSALGKTQSEIAQTLHVSPETIKASNRSLREKLDAPTTTNAVYKAMRWGLFD